MDVYLGDEMTEIKVFRSLDAVVAELLDIPEELVIAHHVETKPVDVEVAESKPLTGWLAVADSICHGPWRKH